MRRSTRSKSGRSRQADFVFYAIFEWQDRKSPERTMEAYFRAFREDDGTILVLKTNPGAAGVAARALQEMRVRTRSRARAAVRAEAWSEDSDWDSSPARRLLRLPSPR